MSLVRAYNKSNRKSIGVKLWEFSIFPYGEAQISPNISLSLYMLCKAVGF